MGLNYRKLYKNNNFEFTQKIIKGSKPSFWLNSIYFKVLSPKKVREIGNELMKSGVEVRSGFWPLNKLKSFKSLYVKKKSVSEEIFFKTLVLPSSYNLKASDIKLINKKILDILSKL